MTNEIVPQSSALDQILQGPEGDVLRHHLERMLVEVMEAEVHNQIGASLHERSESRTSHRNGYREREFETRMGSLSLAIPKVRRGTYFPSFLEPRRRAEKALVAVVQEAFLHGTSCRKVDDLVQALGGPGMDKSRVSRMCAELDEEVEAFRTRSLEEEVPYVWLDALYEKVREGGRVRSKAVVIATGVTAEGRRSVLGIDVGETESYGFWKDFLRGLVKRGLKGVQLVISDAHEGLKRAIAEVLLGATWQRCRVHAMRSLLTHVHKSMQAMVLAAVKTIFVQTNQAEARRQLEEVSRTLGPRCPKAAELLQSMAEDVLSYMSFPPEHWRQLHSTNPLERLNREVRRRTRVVGIFPNVNSLLRLVTMLLAEQDDEWQAGEKAYFSRRSMAKITETVLAPPDLLKEVATA
jgi:transposase-like protein